MKRIKSIEVKNFKSLVDFKIDLAKFSCLIGLNGAGKSTVLQFIDFLSQLVRGHMEEWFEERDWALDDVKSQLTQDENIEFIVTFMDEAEKTSGQWEATYNPWESRCIQEQLHMLDHTVEVRKDSVTITDLKANSPIHYDVAFNYTGSILSQLKEDLLPPSIQKCKQLIGQIKSIGLLAPEFLRKFSRESSSELGLGGQNLSKVLHEMTDQSLDILIKKLKTAYPRHLQGIAVKSVLGYKYIEISESYEKRQNGAVQSIATRSRHVNDGTLRLIAILAELQSDHQFSLFDEIENGINPELIEFILNELVTTPKQIMVTTHSPMILNYLDDDVAREGVLYLYKNRMGHTKSIPFFDIPSLSEKLTVMGPGEAFVDTDLTALRDEIEAIPKGQ